MKDYITKLAALTISRRFQLALMTVVVVFLQDYLGLSEEFAWQIVAVVSAWILGDSLNKT
jgi:hypothetical protein